jgi:NAD(P)-dependent dehydrogenase (short-subunit alcohol dehydrogenase family)
MATTTMAQALAPAIRVNGIGPGPTLPNERQNQADFEAQVEALILRKGPELSEFGRTIRFLFETPSITGQMIALDGGQHLAWETPDILEIVE